MQYRLATLHSLLGQQVQSWAKLNAEVKLQSKFAVDSVEINQRERESLLVLVGDRLKSDSFVAFCCRLLRAGFAMSRSF